MRNHSDLVWKERKQKMPYQMDKALALLQVDGIGFGWLWAGSGGPPVVR